MNKGTLKTLLNYKKFSRKTMTFYELRTEEFELGKKEGLMFDNIKLTHNQALDWLFEGLRKVEKHQVVALFLASFTENRIDWRCGLSAFALCKNLPIHEYSVELHKSKYCQICGDWLYEDPKEIDLTFYNQCRFSGGGGIIGDDIFDICYLAFCIDQHLRMPIKIPREEDIEIFNRIINAVSSMKIGDTPNDLEKKIAAQKIFKSNHWQRRYVLETLSFCGIIENPNAKGYMENYIPPNNRYRDNDINEWNYPIRLWRGEHGINHKSLQFWFQEFL
jgi:hypothetical protein